jgi:hypothetical protein
MLPIACKILLKWHNGRIARFWIIARPMSTVEVKVIGFLNAYTGVFADMLPENVEENRERCSWDEMSLNAAILFPRNDETTD